MHISTWMLRLSVASSNCSKCFQVARDVGIHCILAEAAARIEHLEERVTKLKHDEMLTQASMHSRWCN